MTWQIAITLLSIAVMITALARNWSGPDILLTAELTLLMALGIVSPKDAIAGFGNEGPVTVAILFVITAGLTETGGMSLLTRPLLGLPKTVRGAQVRMMLPVMGMSAFLNNTPVVAMFMPVLSDWCKKARLSPSKLFIPLSYAAVLGGVCTLIGTSTNIVVNGLLVDAHLADAPKMGMFTLTPVGLVVAATGFLFMLLAAPRLLPDRKDALTDHQEAREYTVEMLVEPGSAVDGRTIEQAELRHLPGLFLVEIERDGQAIVAVGPDQTLKGNDRLLFVGNIASVVDLQKIRGLIPATAQIAKLDIPRPERCLVEAVVSAASPFAGKTVRESQFRTTYNGAIIAVHRHGERLPGKIGNILLLPGDVLLFETAPRFLERLRRSSDFLLVSKIEGSAPMRHDRAGIALAILVSLVIVVGFEWVGMLTAGFVAASAMLLARCCSIEQARRSIDWPILVTIGAAIGIGKALETCGAAAWVAHGFIPWFQPFGAVGLLAGVYLITLIFTEILTNNAAAVLVFPIAKAVAVSMSLSFMPFVIVIAIAASCGFAMPLGYQTHLMVYGAGGYRTSDFLKIGLPLDILIGVVAVAVTPIFFPF